MNKDVFNEINIDNGIVLVKSRNYSENDVLLNTKRQKLFIQFHFVLEGSVKFLIIKGTHKLTIDKNESLLFFNPRNIIPIDAVVEPNSKMLSLLFSLDAIYKLFDNFSLDFNFLKPGLKYKKLYSKQNLTPNELIILNQIFNRKLNNKLDIIYVKAKILELFTFYFNNNIDINNQKSEQLKDKRLIEKIKKAKEILIANIDEPPSINELSDQVLLPVNVLKKGFKELYGESVYKYILSYKLELARQLLLSKKFSVKEISYKMGYSAPTHFVVAFKKKFGITPKKYIKNQA